MAKHFHSDSRCNQGDAPEAKFSFLHSRAAKAQSPCVPLPQPGILSARATSFCICLVQVCFLPLVKRNQCEQSRPSRANVPNGSPAGGLFFVFPRDAPIASECLSSSEITKIRGGRLDI